MNRMTVRDELVATLEEALGIQTRLVRAARDEEISVADLVAQVTVLEQLDDRRDDLIRELRHVASASLRAAQPGPPVRQMVLEALKELRWPQNAKFLEEYLWARRGLQVNSRAFASLRRDERRAWERAPGARQPPEYVAPALNADGSANSGWFTNSNWPTERRIVGSQQTERLLDLQKIMSLAGRTGSAEAHDYRPWGEIDRMLARHAERVLEETGPPSPTAPLEEIVAWRTKMRERADHQISEIRRVDDPRRKQLERQFAKLPENQRLWGAGS